MSKFFSIVKHAGQDFVSDGCMTSGAALAYYMVFSLPPLLVLIFFTAGAMGVSEERISQVVSRQLGIPIPDAAGMGGGEADSGGEASENQAAANEPSADQQNQQGSLSAIAQRRTSEANVMESLGPASRVLGIGLLLFAATGVFAQLQQALNQAWEVEPDPEQGGFVSFLLKRILSLGRIVVIAFLLLISLVLSSMLDEIIRMIQGETPSGVARVVGMVLNLALSTAMATILFAAVYKILPDADMRWRDVWMGGLITAVLFVIGKTAIGYYLENSNIGSSWGGAAASMVALLVWVYYSSLIVLFGAELTQAWVREYGGGIHPSKKAIRVVCEKKRLAEGEESPAGKGSYAS